MQAKHGEYSQKTDFEIFPWWFFFGSFLKMEIANMLRKASGITPKVPLANCNFGVLRNKATRGAILNMDSRPLGIFGFPKFWFH